jgi:glycosyltransferase involved in cell wall biosynthesis
MTGVQREEAIVGVMPQALPLQVAAITAGGNTPSARFRVRQIVPELSQYGVDVTELKPVLSPFTPNPLRRYYHGLSRLARSTDIAWGVVKAITRLPEVVLSRRYDATWLSKGLVPGTITSEPLLRRPFVLDVDDAIWVRNRLARRAVPALARRAQIVFAGNSWIMSSMQEFAEDVRLVPTVVDIAKFRPSPKSLGKPLILGWSGTSSNFHYLYDLEPVLVRFLKEGTAKLRIVADREPAFKRIDPADVEFFRWDEAHEVELIQSMDIGLMPLGTDQWSYGKCAFKLLTYLACGVPAIASPVSANSEILDAAHVGVPAADPDQWLQGLRLLSQDRDLRETMGRAGRALVEQRYSIQTVAPLVARAFADLCCPQA